MCLADSMDTMGKLIPLGGSAHPSSSWSIWTFRLVYIPILPLPSRTSPWSQVYLDHPSLPVDPLSHPVHPVQAGCSLWDYKWLECRCWILISVRGSSFLLPGSPGVVPAGQACRGGAALPAGMRTRKEVMMVRGWGLSSGCWVWRWEISIPTSSSLMRAQSNKTVRLQKQYMEVGIWSSLWGSELPD